MLKDFRSLASDVVAELKRQGADACDVYIVMSSDFRTDVRLGQIEKLEQSISKGMGMRVFKKGATAITYTTDFADKSIKSLARQVMDTVQVSGADKFNGLAPKERLGIFDGKLAMFDASLASISTERKVDIARQMEDAGRAFDKRITNSDGASWSDSQAQITLANSDGFTGQYQVTGASANVALIAEQDGVKQRDSWYTFGRYASGLADPKEIGETAAKRAISKLGAKKPKSQVVPVVIDPALSRNLLSLVFSAASGRSIYRKASFLVDKIGEQIASPLVTIVDDSTLANGPASRPFDGEGVKGGKVVLVDGGKLTTYLCDSYSSRRLGMPLTGTTARGWQGGPVVGQSNLFLEAGKTAPEDIIKSVKNGLYLRTLSSQGMNSVTGDFSHGATGYWIENGEIAYSVQEFTVAGNVISLLKNITAVGNDLSFKQGGTAGPTLFVSEITVGGA